MRLVIVASAVGALALAGATYWSGPAEAAKTKMGCQIGKEVWSANAGKCVPGKSKYGRTASSKMAKKKAAPKSAPAASKGAPAEKK